MRTPLLLLLGLALLVGCDNPVRTVSPLTPRHGFQVSWMLNNSRAILPTAFPALASYDVTLTPSSGTPLVQEGVTTSTAHFENLSPSVYNVTVNGKDSNGKVVASGNSAIDLTLSTDASTSILLNYITEGAGTGQIHLTFAYPGTEVNQVEVNIVDPDGVSVSPSIVAGVSQHTYVETSAKVGWYQLFVSLKSSSQTSMRMTTILVVQNVDTVATLSFVPEDFSTTYVPVTSVGLNKTVESGRYRGQVDILTATLNEGASNRLIQWSSSDPTVASVDQTGVVSVAKAGTAVITAKSIENPSAKATCSYTVDPVTVTLDQTSLRLTAGGSTGLLKATVAKAVDTGISWTTSNATVATVAGGTVTPLIPGTTIIRATSVSDGTTQSECTVTVEESSRSQWDFSTQNADFTGTWYQALGRWRSVTIADQQTSTSEIVIPVTGADPILVSFSYGGESEANYDKIHFSFDGLEQTLAPNSGLPFSGSFSRTFPVSPGNHTLTFTYTKDVSIATGLDYVWIDDLVVDTNPPVVAVSGIALDSSSLRLTANGSSAALVSSIHPSNATNQTINWSSSVPAVATVTNGTVTPLSAGTTTITATTVDGGKIATCSVTVWTPVTGFLVTPKVLALGLNSGGETLTASVSPANATYGTVTWSSNAPTIAAVSSDGRVTPVGIGSATIRASTAGSPEEASWWDECVVTVTSSLVPVTGVTMDLSSMDTLTVGGFGIVYATVAPSNATNKLVSWSSTNTSVATVSGGTVTPVAPGSATIIATTADGNFTATCTVTVIITVSNVSISSSTLDLTAGGSSSTLTASVLPANAGIKTLSWTSSMPSVATVSNGVITPLAAGTTTITARSVQNSLATASCTVTVAAQVLDAPTAVSATDGTSTDRITVTWNPVTGADKYYVQRSTNNAFTSPDWEVVVGSPPVPLVDTSVSAGTTYYYRVKATNSTNGAVSDYSTHDGGYIPVPTVAVTGVGLSSPTLELTIGTSATILTATVSPTNATTKTITWASSNTGVATVAPSGAVTPVGSGTANITATSGTITATCAVSVYPAGAASLNVSAKTTTSITLSWTAATGATRYMVTRAASSSGPYVVQSNTMTSPGFTDVSLSPGTSYWYQVYSGNSLGWLNHSDLSATTDSPPTLSPPAGLTVASKTTTSITLSWGAAANATVYRVSRATSSSGPFSVLSSSIGNTGYSDNGLSPATQYWYQVFSGNSYGYSSTSSTLSSTTSTAAPGQVNGVSATDGSYNADIRISWSPTGTSGVTTEIQRSTDSGFSGGLTTITTNATSNPYIDSGVSSLKDYYYRVRETNSAGTGAWSSSDSGWRAPKVTVSPTTVNAGTFISQPGSGFTPNGTVTMHFYSPIGVDTAKTVTADASGNYSSTFTQPTPVSNPGSWSYQAQDMTTGRWSTVFWYTLQ